MKVVGTALGDSVHGTGLPGTGSLTIYSKGGSVNGFTSVRGTTEVVECNRHGLCNQNTGIEIYYCLIMIC